MIDQNVPAYKIYKTIIQGSILVFTLALVYFAFVYYPQVIKDYKKGNVPPGKPVIAPVSATSNKFPIETKNYRITYEEGSDTYYVFIAGDKLDQYLVNKNSAALTLKNVLAVDSLCKLNIIYNANDTKLLIPEQYRSDPNCK